MQDIITMLVTFTFICVNNIFGIREPQGGMSMTVLAVTPNLFQTNKKQNLPTNYINNTPIANDYRQNNNLYDINHSYLQVIKNNVSFRGNSGFLLDTKNLAQKISSILSVLPHDEILLVGKDFNLLKEGLSILLKQEFKANFIETEGVSLALEQHPEGFSEVRNLGTDSLWIQRERAPKPHELKYGEKALVLPGDSYKGEAEGTSFEFNLLPTNDVKTNVTSTKAPQVTSDNEVIPNVTFADIGGQDEAINKLKRVVLYQIKYPDFFARNINQRGHGALLIGSPGEGKSLAALATANEAGVRFFYTKPDTFKGSLMGENEEKIRRFYYDLRQNQPCLAYFDEANVTFPVRTGNPNNTHNENDSQLHYVLMSDLEKEGAQVYFMAATNKPEAMDVAARRRFDTHIEFTSPDTPERCQAIFDIHTKHTQIQNFDKSNFMNQLVKARVSGNDIANIVVDAQINAIERLGIFDRMEKGIFEDTLDFKITVTGADFTKALKNLTTQREMIGKYSKEVVITPFGH